MFGLGDGADSLHPKVRAFVEKACAGIVSSKRAREVELELLTHIQEIIEELSSTHMNDEQIAEEVLRRMGDPDDLESKIALANRSPVRHLFFRLFKYVSIIAFGGFIISSIFFYHRELGRFKKDRELIRAKVRSIEAAQRNAPLADFTRPLFSGSDAGPFLNKFLTGNRRTLDTGEFRLSESLREALKTADFRKIGNGDQKLDLEGTDLSWMRKLKSFDYWDIFKKDDAQKTSRSYLDLPGGVVLLEIAKARLVMGIQEGRLNDALEDVYHLGRLEYSSHLLIHAMLGLNALTQVREVYELGLANGKVKKLAWINWTNEEVFRLKDLTRQTATLYSSFAASPDDLEIAIEHPEWSAGVCAGLTEAILYSGFIDPFFATTWPLEFSAREHFEAVRTLIARNTERCRLGSVTQSDFVAEIQNSRGEFLGDSFFVMRYVRHVPYIRRIYGLALARIVAPAK